MPHQACAGHAVGMAHRDGATVDVEAFIRNSELVRAVQHLYREGFIELPEVDVRDALAGALQQLRYGEYGPDAHLVRLAARDREPAEDAERFRPELTGTCG